MSRLLHNCLLLIGNQRMRRTRWRTGRHLLILLCLRHLLLVMTPHVASFLALYWWTLVPSLTCISTCIPKRVQWRYSSRLLYRTLSFWVILTRQTWLNLLASKLLNSCTGKVRSIWHQPIQMAFWTNPQLTECFELNSFPLETEFYRCRTSSYALNCYPYCP